MGNPTENLQPEPNRGGRPSGTRSLERSTLVARVRDKMDKPQEDFARLIGVRERTVRNYETKSVIPKSGLVRAAIERLARANDVPLKKEEEGEL